jgi:hypothetical protein
MTALHFSPRKDNRIALPGGRYIAHGSAVLVQMASDRPAKGDWNADRWLFTVSAVAPGSTIPAAVLTLDYRTGTGLRRPAVPASRTDLAMPWEPEVQGVLYSIASDLSCALYLPQDDANALDHLAAEFGHDKPGEALRMLRALRLGHDNAVAFLRKIGLAPEKFIEWAYSEECGG